MPAQEVDASPRVLARIGGALYLIIIVAGIFGEAFVRDRLIVSADATATADNIRTFELLWRVGIAGNLLHLACAVALTWILYVLLRPVSRDLALLAAFFELVSIGVEAVSKLFLVEALFPLRNAEYLQVFAPEQLHALAYLPTRLHAFGFGVSLIFFGCACVVLGYLIFRSGYLPKLVGVLMQIAGLCYRDEQLRADSGPGIRRSTIPRDSDSFLHRGNLALPLAHGEGRGRREVASTSRRGTTSRRGDDSLRLPFPQNDLPRVHFRA